MSIIHILATVCKGDPVRAHIKFPDNIDIPEYCEFAMARGTLLSGLKIKLVRKGGYRINHKYNAVTLPPRVCLPFTGPQKRISMAGHYSFPDISLAPVSKAKFIPRVASIKAGPQPSEEHTLNRINRTLDALRKLDENNYVDIMYDNKKFDPNMLEFFMLTRRKIKP
tara:strand:- start:3751 stop:4251 length:501 start_codon:yes stop_codon:yes gene_type:complete